MGCFSSKTNDDKNENSAGEEPEMPAEEVAPKTKEVDAPSENSMKNFYGKHHGPAVGEGDESGEMVFDKPDPSQYIDDAEIEGAKAKAEEDEKESSDCVLKRVNENHEGFSEQERKEVTEFLNKIEEIATQQGVFGELAR